MNPSPPRRLFARLLPFCLLVAPLAGCGSAGDPRFGAAEEAASACVDADGDGYGAGCDAGDDCDDDDPAVGPSCPDGGAAAPACVEGDQVACKVLLPQHGAVSPCFVGVEICSGGVWSACGKAPAARR